MGESYGHRRRPDNTTDATYVGHERIMIQINASSWLFQIVTVNGQKEQLVVLVRMMTLGFIYLDVVSKAVGMHEHTPFL